MLQSTHGQPPNPNQLAHLLWSLTRNAFKPSKVAHVGRCRRVFRSSQFSTQPCIALLSDFFSSRLLSMDAHCVSLAAWTFMQFEHVPSTAMQAAMVTALEHTLAKQHPHGLSNIMCFFAKVCFMWMLV